MAGTRARRRHDARPRFGGVPGLALAVLALLLLVSGVGRQFVLCLGHAHGDGGIQRVVALHHDCCHGHRAGARHVRAANACDLAAHAEEHGNRDGVRSVCADAGMRGHARCLDLRLPGLEGERSPAPPLPPLACAPPAVAPALPPLPRDDAANAHAPPTGPPRPDAGAAVRRTVVLQV